MSSSISSTSSISSRRDNQASSSSSRSERSSTRSNGIGNKPAVESAVTRLLVAIKQLLESLTLWSQQKESEMHVSDVYVRLGNDFNAAVAAFGSFNIDMKELLSVPDDLRAVLEVCLAEDATPENLEIYLPDVRKIITRLLQGLRGKQSIYRRIVSEHRHTSSNTSNPDRPESRTSSRHESVSSSGGRRPSRGAAEVSDSVSRRSASSTKSKKESVSTASSRPSTNGSDQFVGGFVMQVEDPVSVRSSTPGRSRATNGSSSRTGSTPVQASAELPVTSRSSTPQQETVPLPRPPSVYAPVPSHVPRFSLTDKPMISTSTPPPAPAVVVDEVASPQLGSDDTPSSRIPPSPIEPDPAPAVQSSLAALKKSDVLERRASKRFSTYNISKMTGGSIRERMTSGNHGSRLSIAPSGALTSGDLVTLDEEDERSPSPAKRGARRGGRNPSPITEDDEPPPVPPLPSRDPSPFKSPRIPSPLDHPSTTNAKSEGKSGPMTVFLQVGRQVKKVTIEPGLTTSSLRVLFVDRFSYSPGKDNFPAIYIRDPHSGVQYELEDIDEIKDRCLLSLNIEPLDQIKQHIDTQISTLSQDIKDLRTMVSSSRRASMQAPPMILGQPLAESTPAPNRPSDRSFRQAARQLSRLIPDRDEEDHPTPTRSEPIISQMTGASIQPQMTGVSVMSDASTRIVTDLKTQFDEVQNLRRDLGIMRQLYTEFMKQTKESLGTLRTQTQNVRQLATNKVGGARAYIDDGKTKLDSRSQNVLTKMEELQDTVEGIKDDVLKRNVSPRPQVLKAIKADIDSVTAELESLKDHIQTIKPMWKKTWEEELQNIVEEQQFLSHQEEFLNDLLDDHKAVLEVYGHVEKVISLRGTGSGRVRAAGRGFRPPPPSDEGGISNVMLEIRTATVDAERRMKAIAANEKQREKELAARSDEFQAELTGFVEGKKLKMTGGAEEVERVRQKRNESTLKAMFTGGGSGTTTPSTSAASLAGEPPLPPLPSPSS